MTKIDFLENSALLLEQWKSSTNLKGIVDAFMARGNDIQDALFEIRDLMYIDTAEGEGLDFIGKTFNESRGSRNDTEYRAAIKKKAATRYSGEPETIISVLQALYGATTVVYSPEYPGKYRVRTDADIEIEDLQTLSPAGVQGFHAGFLIDATGAHIVSGNTEHIIQVFDGLREVLTDGNGASITDGDDLPIETQGHY